MHVSPSGLGIVLGAFAGIVHIVWAVLVATGLAQPLVYYILYFHFLTVPMRVAPFDLLRALILITGTSILGYAAGALIAVLWNELNIPERIRKKI